VFTGPAAKFVHGSQITRSRGGTPFSSPVTGVHPLMLKELLFGGKGAADKLGDLGLLILRVFLGLTMAVAHGLPKVQNPSRVIDGLAGSQIPMPQVTVWFAILAEFLGGILLALGLLTRPAAFFTGFTMVVAGFVIHASDPYKVKELAFAYLAASLLLVFTGGGRFSVDQLIRK